jgi:hypothetical protein
MTHLRRETLPFRRESGQGKWLRLPSGHSFSRIIQRCVLPRYSTCERPFGYRARTSVQDPAASGPVDASGGIRAHENREEECFPSDRGHVPPGRWRTGPHWLPVSLCSEPYGGCDPCSRPGYGSSLRPLRRDGTAFRTRHVRNHLRHGFSRRRLPWHRSTDVHLENRPAVTRLLGLPRIWAPNDTGPGIGTRPAASFPKVRVFMRRCEFL